MKKLTAISILLVLLSVAAFAQLKVGFGSSFWTDAVPFEKTTDDMTDADSVNGVFNVFTSSSLNENELWLVTYTGNFFKGYLQLKGDGLVKRGEKPFSESDDPVFMQTVTSSDAMAGSFRVSGGKIADFISFDVIYKLNGQEEDTRPESNADVYYDEVSKNTLVGNSWDNELGAYVGLDLFKGLKLGLGYTAAFLLQEKTRIDGAANNATIEYVNPVYNGISLRLNYTGIPNFGVSLNNNVSFAWQRGENEIDTATGGRVIKPMGYDMPAWGSVGVNGKAFKALDSFGGQLDDGSGQAGAAGNMKNNDQKDSWFALWNSLALAYNITEKARASLVVSNKLGVYDFTAVPDESWGKWTANNFQAALFGTYAFSGNVSFVAGLNLNIWGMKADVTMDNQNTTGKTGEVKIALPVQFVVNF